MYFGTASISALNTPVLCSSVNGEWSVIPIGNRCSPKIYYSSVVADTSSGPINTAYSYGADLTARYDGEGLVYCYPTGKGEYAIVLERYGNKLIKKIRVMNVGSNGIIECGSGDDEYAIGGDETAIEANPTKKQQYIRIGEGLRRCTKENVQGAVRDGDMVGNVDGRRVRCDLKSIETLNTLAQPKCIDVMDHQD